MLKMTITKPLDQVFVTSDTHFMHKNIIEYAGRPFATLAEMDRALIANWNEVVGPRDVIFHLGDFGFGNREENKRILKLLNGTVYFVRGNHDGGHPFDNQADLLDIRVGNESFVLCHYAMRVWDRSHRGVRQLYGHSHGCLEDDPKLRSMDVGVDSIAKIKAGDGPLRPEYYRPVSLRWVIDWMNENKEPFVPPF